MQFIIFLKSSFPFPSVPKRRSAEGLDDKFYELFFMIHQVVNWMWKLLSAAHKSAAV